MFRVFIVFILFFTVPFIVQSKIPDNRYLLAVENDAYSRGPAPEWARSYSYKEVQVSPLDCVGGERVLLASQQTDVASRTTYFYGIKQIVNEAGAQNNTYISLPFDPEFEKIILHTFRIHRGADTINLLNSIAFDVIQQEADLQKFLYNGRLSLVAFITDIQVDDILELSFSIQGSNPIFEGKYSETFPLQKKEAVDRLIYRVIVPKGRTFYTKQQCGAQAPAVSSLPNGDQEWIWDLSMVPEIKEDEDAPVWFEQCPSVQISEHRSWEECNVWASKLFELPGEFSEALLQLAEECQQQRTPEERALCALRFVQDKIRYLGIESGLGSHQPADPSEVLKRGYGDCKDKVFLLHTLLRLIGIESYPALVNTVMGVHVEAGLPTPLAFDHVVISIKVEGNTYWVDPTVSQQGGRLSSHSCAVFGKALRLKAGDQDLCPIVSYSKIPQIEIESTYEMSEKYLGAKLSIRTLFRAGGADSVRHVLQKEGRAGLAKHFQQLRGKALGSFQELTPMKISDDRSGNQIEITELYDVQNVWEVSSGTKRMTIVPMAASDNVPPVVDPARQIPFAIKHPVHIKEHVHVIGVPLAKQGNFKKEFRGKAFSCVVDRTVRSPNRLDYTFELQTHQDFVPAKELARHRDLVYDVQNALHPQLSLPHRKMR